MERPLKAGKLPPQLLASLLERAGPWPDEVRLGPAPGEDACALAIGDELLVVASDPITLTGREVGAHAVVVNANDVAVTGARPRWFLAAVLLPPQTCESDVRALFERMQQRLDELDVVLVGGHTEVTPAVTQPVVVGQMLGLASGGFVRTGDVQPGDAIVQVGATPLEGAAVLAQEASGRLANVDEALREQARRALEQPGICVVAAALAARELGARALHDPTEGGIAAGLHELASASGLALRVRRHDVAWFEPGVAVCRALGADPWCTLASGTLLAAFPPERCDAALEALAREGSPARAIGVAEPGRGVWLDDGRPLVAPERDEVARLLADERAH